MINNVHFDTPHFGDHVLAIASIPLGGHARGLTYVTRRIRLFEQLICSRRQLTFELYRNNDLKIGMNTAGNKFYHINKLIGLDKLNLSFVHFKKLMKIQFLKNGKT